MKIKTMTLCALFTALIAVGAFIKIPVPVVPFTLQLLFTTLAGLLLGGKYGALSVFCYLVLGLIGFPVFAEGGGITYIFKPSFGYLIGFCLGAYATGIIANRKDSPSLSRLLGANFAGLFIVYACGLVYYWMISTFYLGTGIAVWTLFFYGFVVAVPGDIVICILTAFLAKRLIPIVRRSDFFRLSRQTE